MKHVYSTILVALSFPCFGADLANQDGVRIIPARAIGNTVLTEEDLAKNDNAVLLGEDGKPYLLDGPASTGPNGCFLRAHQAKIKMPGSLVLVGSKDVRMPKWSVAQEVHLFIPPKCVIYKPGFSLNKLITYKIEDQTDMVYSAMWTNKAKKTSARQVGRVQGDNSCRILGEEEFPELAKASHYRVDGFVKFSKGKSWLVFRDENHYWAFSGNSREDQTYSAVAADFQCNDAQKVKQ